MTLEGGHDLLGCSVVEAAWRDTIAVIGERPLQVGDFFTSVARSERDAGNDRLGLDPQTDAGRGEPRPWKPFARVALAGGRDVGMGEHTERRDRPTAEDVARERDHGLDLRVGEFRTAFVMPRVADFDPDRARIDVARAFPGRFAGKECGAG